jgi:hypothetical protein
MSVREFSFLLGGMLDVVAPEATAPVAEVVRTKLVDLHMDALKRRSRKGR